MTGSPEACVSKAEGLTEVGEGVCLGYGSDAAAAQGAAGALRAAHAHAPARPERHVHARPRAGTLVHPHAGHLPDRKMPPVTAGQRKQKTEPASHAMLTAIPTLGTCHTNRSRW